MKIHHSFLVVKPVFCFSRPETETMSLCLKCNARSGDLGLALQLAPIIELLASNYVFHMFQSGFEI